MQNYIEEIIKEELDKIHGEVHYIDTDRETVEDRVREIVHKLLLKCKEAVGEEIAPERWKYITEEFHDGWDACRSTTLQNLDNLEK